jgi:diacylglycerol kinase family enzyme
MRVAILSNHRSGRGRAARLARRLQLSLHERGHACWQAETSADEHDPRTQEVIGDAELVVVCGGDGSLRTSARAACASGAMLWHAPAGTENLFARHFGMRGARTLEQAIDRARVAEIDLWSADGHVFLVMASVGLDADIVSEVAAKRTGPQGRGQWLWPTLRQAVAWRAPLCHVHADDGQVRSHRGGFVAANLPSYAARLDPVSRAVADDGLLHGLAMGCASAAGLVPWALRGWLGLTGSACMPLPQGRVRVETDRPCLWQLDGCPMPGGNRTSVVLERDPRRVRVLLPAGDRRAA